MYKLIFLTLTLTLTLVLAACGDDGVSPTDLIPAGASAWIGDEIAIRDLEPPRVHRRLGELSVVSSA